MVCMKRLPRVFALFLTLTPFLFTSAEAQQIDASRIARTALPCVGIIYTYDANGDTIAQGSGFVMAPGNVCVTNYHVMDGAVRAVLRLPSAQYELVRVLTANQQKDFTILSVQTSLRGLPLGSMDSLSIGDPVLAIGSPVGYAGTVSTGIISAIRDLEGSGRLIQTTAPISPGSSGGPLLDAAGRVIGINTLTVIEGQNINFSIPINWILEAHRDSPGQKVQVAFSGFGEGHGLRTPPPAYLEGLFFLDQEDYTTALKAFSEATTRDPRDALAAWIMMGCCDQKLHRYEDAIRDYTQVIRINPNIGYAYLHRGDAFYNLNRFEDALRDYTQAIRIDSNSAMAYLGRAGSYLNFNRHEDAIRDFTIALRLDANLALAYFGRGIAYKGLGRLDEAWADQGRLRQLDPNLARNLAEMITER
jgi:Tfp pilus assembly protein PilF